MTSVLLLLASCALLIGALEATPLFNSAFNNNGLSISDAFGRLRTQAEQFPWSQALDKLQQNLQNRLNQVQWPSVANTDFFQNSLSQLPSVSNTDFFNSGFGNGFAGGFFSGR